MPLTELPLITTARLRLRRVVQSDLPDLLTVNGDEQVTRFLPYPSWQHLADGQAWFERMQAREAAGDTAQFVLESRASGRVIGACLLFRHDAPSARAELGYVLGRAHWRQGLASEALAAFVKGAFNTLALRRLEAEVNPLNAASNRLLLSLGFQHEGLLRERWMDKGQAVDSNFYGLLRDEWLQHVIPSC